MKLNTVACFDPDNLLALLPGAAQPSDALIFGVAHAEEASIRKTTTHKPPCPYQNEPNIDASTTTTAREMITLTITVITMSR